MPFKNKRIPFEHEKVCCQLKDVLEQLKVALLQPKVVPEQIKVHPARLKAVPLQDKDVPKENTVVLCDVNNGHNEPTMEKYGQPTQFGLPVIVVLDSDGKQLVTQSVGEFGEVGGYSPPKVSAFLNAWASKK